MGPPVRSDAVVTWCGRRAQDVDTAVVELVSDRSERPGRLEVPQRAPSGA